MTDERDGHRFTLSSWERFGPYVGLLIVLAFTVAAISMIQHDRGVRRNETNAQHAADQKRDEAQRAADLKLAKTSFLATCERHNQNRKAIRDAIIGNADDLGGLVLEFVNDRQTAQLFADQLHRRAVFRANEAARPVDCSFPPKTKAGL